MTPESTAAAIRLLIETANDDRIVVYAIPSGTGGHQLFSGYLMNDVGEADVLICDVSL